MKAIYTLLLFVFLLSVSSFDNPISAPEPEIFGKKLVQVLKTGDTTLYKKTFGINKELMQVLFNQLFEDPYSSLARRAGYKEQAQKNMERASSEVDEFISENFKIIEAWKEHETIDLNKLEYLRTYYEMENSEEGIVILQKAGILIKHENTLYKMNYRDIAWIADSWRGGKLRSIDKLDAEFRQAKSYNEYSLSGELDYEVAVADTVAAVAAIEDTAIADEAIPLATVDPKKQKKMDKLRKKMEKLSKE